MMMMAVWKALGAGCRDGAARQITQSVSVFYPMIQWLAILP